MVNEARKNKGMTLIELMVVISIIGLLSSIISAGLNAARDKAHDAKIKANLSTIETQAALDYAGNHDSYGGTNWIANTTMLPLAGGTPGSTAVFNDPAVVAAMRSALSSAGSISYGSNGTSWIVVAPLRTADFWCVSSDEKNSGEKTYLAPTASFNYGAPYKCP